MIVLEKLLSTLVKEVLVEADPGMFSIQHDPEAVSETGSKVHGTRRRIPRLIGGGHILCPQVDQVP